MSTGELGIHRLGVVVVTHNPDHEVESRLVKMAAQGGAFVVVDNASQGEARKRLAECSGRQGWVFVSNPGNYGLGVALNQGVRTLIDRGYEWVLLFDQDSVPSDGMSVRLLEALRRYPDGEHVAVIGGTYHERLTGRVHRVLRRHPLVAGFFQKITPQADDLLDVTAVITSGSLVRVADFQRIGGFDEGLFIDYVDTDFCLRCLTAGRRIAVSAAARFEHSFGHRTAITSWCGLKLEPTNHSALRHYYIARNRVWMWRRFSWRLPHWAAFDLAAAGLWLFRVVMAEAGKRMKLRAMIQGTWDGLRGRTGACPERLQAVLMNDAGPAGQDHRRSQ